MHVCPPPPLSYQQKNSEAAAAAQAEMFALVSEVEMQLLTVAVPKVRIKTALLGMVAEQAKMQATSPPPCVEASSWGTQRRA